MIIGHALTEGQGTAAKLHRRALKLSCALAMGGNARLGAAAKIVRGGGLLRLTVPNAGR